MHTKSATELYELARGVLDEYENADDAWPIYRDEANARYNAEDDGEHSAYTAEAVKIFENAKLDAFADAEAS